MRCSVLQFSLYQFFPYYFQVAFETNAFSCEQSSDNSDFAIGVSSAVKIVSFLKSDLSSSVARPAMLLTLSRDFSRVNSSLSRGS